MEKNKYNIIFISVKIQIVRNGHIKRITDPDITSSVLEIMGANVSTTYISTPDTEKQTLGIKLPYLVMIIKNMKKYFTFEVQVLDDRGIRRRFRASNYQVILLNYLFENNQSKYHCLYIENRVPQE